METITKSAKETFEFGRKIGSSLKGGEILALIGELGAGKTTFIQGLAKGMGIENKIVSPTFILMRTYAGDKLNLYHLDLYRLEGDVRTHVRELGIEDFWGRNGNVAVVEWADKSKEIFPEKTVWINFEKINEDTRKITVEGL
ncbi:MAG TPA: tRNA (adenosine(37)-N6)-threonylcarbamoyltransferase complex ATPase subunit type 1 TsaE, partial [Candidatus Saccharimonadales bacterium]|nr:tRNA (adenosine(37)-N6)-threonylcarbamoyltransferase complex ATPase subunit type 1 TsaE [Candidatus Saccharimonadales bacterium]